MALNVGNADIVLGTTATTIVTAPSNSQITILKATAVNVSGGALTLTLYRVPNGGTAGATNCLIDATPIGAGETLVLPLSGQTLVNSQTLQGLASAASDVNVNVSFLQTP